MTNTTLREAIERLATEWEERAGLPPHYFGNIHRAAHARALRALLAEHPEESA